MCQIQQKLQIGILKRGEPAVNDTTTVTAAGGDLL